MPTIQERLDQGPLLIDGAIGTMLHRKGVAFDSCYDASNLNHPELVFEIHRTYLEAGVDILETNTFTANPYKLEDHGLADQIRAINVTGVELARRAVEESDREGILIAGCVGPLGVRLAPIGRVTGKQAYDAFYRQLAALLEAGIDLLVLESFSDLAEIEQAVTAARDIDAGLFIAAQMTFTRDDRTLMGDTPSQVAEKLSGLSVDAIGANEANGPTQVARIVARMQQVAPNKRAIAMPNAGYPENVGGDVYYSATPEYFADFAVSMRDRGTAIIGGGSGTTPEHIAAMRTALNDESRVGTSSERIVVSHESHVDTSDELFQPSQLARKFARGEFILAVEMSPPKGVAAEKELRAAEMLKEVGADVIDVLDSPMARMRMSPWALCRLLQSECGIESVLHFPTRGRNMLRVQGDLLAAHALGVRNLFIVMGDPTKIGDYPEAHDNYDIVPTGLIKLVKEDLNNGVDHAGNSIGQPTNFLVSAALSPSAPDPDREVRLLHKKVTKGADYFLTQPIYSVEVYQRFMERYEAAHGPFEKPVLPGILPLYSLRNAQFLHNEVPGIVIPDEIMTRMKDADDPKREGVRIAQELAQQFATVTQGLYLLPQFGRYDLIADVIESVRTPVAK